jgi:DNA-binding transcriptional LysR family regulator
MVHAHASFSEAADALGVSQSSVSYTIARLREAFGDPLFVRSGSGVAPTERCLEIVEQVGQIVDEFEALATPPTFDPGTARLQMSISCNFYEQATVIPKLVRVLRQQAPGLRLNTITSRVQGREQLKRGESDMLIGPIELEESGYYRRKILDDHYVCVMAQGHPLGKAPLSMKAFQEAPHASVNYGGTFRSPFQIDLERLGGTLNTVIEVPSPASLPFVLADTDMIATIPSRVAQAFGSGLHVVPCPVPSQLAIYLQWTPRTHASGAHVWLRRKIAEAASRLTPLEIASTQSG